jgi:hypothetical protein
VLLCERRDTPTATAAAAAVRPCEPPAEAPIPSRTVSQVGAAEEASMTTTSIVGGGCASAAMRMLLLLLLLLRTARLRPEKEERAAAVAAAPARVTVVPASSSSSFVVVTTERFACVLRTGIDGAHPDKKCGAPLACLLACLRCVGCLTQNKARKAFPLSCEGNE